MRVSLDQNGLFRSVDDRRLLWTLPDPTRPLTSWFFLLFTGVCLEHRVPSMSGASSSAAPTLLSASAFLPASSKSPFARPIDSDGLQVRGFAIGAPTDESIEDERIRRRVLRRGVPEPHESGDEDGCDTPLDRRWRKKHGYGYPKLPAKPQLPSASTASAASAAAGSAAPAPSSATGSSPAPSTAPTTSAAASASSAAASGSESASNPAPASAAPQLNVKKKDIESLIRFFASPAASRDAPQVPAPSLLFFPLFLAIIVK